MSPFHHDNEDHHDLSHLEDEDAHGGENHFRKGKVLQNVPFPLYRVKIVHSSETAMGYDQEETLSCSSLTSEGKKAHVYKYMPGDHIVFESRYGRDLGKILGPLANPGVILEDEISIIDKRASDHEMKVYKENIQKEKQAFEICLEKIKFNKLEMKLVSTHYLLDEPKVLFFFTAESRVDFRELVKDLVSIFKMRIELRQIGVRDEARVMGGAGVCSRPYCCHGVSDRLRPVSIKMAKEQNISLNSIKISGPCGRLLCCLAYEYDFYHEEKAKLPPEGLRLPFQDTFLRIIEMNVLNKRVKMIGDDGRYMDLPVNCLRQIDGKWRIDQLVLNEAMNSKK